MNKIALMLVLAVGWRDSQATTDSTAVLGLKDFYELVQNHHPLAQQAQLILQRSEVAVQEYRGAFDPKIVSRYNTKQYQGKDYFDLWNNYVEIPTILNIDLKAGYERNSGSFVNPENSLPSDGLYYAGVSVPLGKGLIHNSRTIGLKKGAVQQKSLKNQALSVYNNLLLDAHLAYCYWYASHQKSEAMASYLQLVSERFEGIRQGVINGEYAAIDSIEALSQVQYWSTQHTKAQLDYQNSIQLMDNFIWVETDPNLRLMPDSTLAIAGPGQLEDHIRYAMNYHPDLHLMQAGLEDLVLDKKLAVENVKPQLDLQYNVLLAGNDTSEGGALFTNNYKGGVSFSFPLFIRKERAKIKQLKLKIEENQHKIDSKRREILNKIQANYAKLLSYLEIIREQNQLTANYDLLWRGEISKFENGESSVFLVNSRETKNIDARMKMVEYQMQRGQAIGLIYWSSSMFVAPLIEP